MLGRVALMVGGATVAVLVSGGTLAPVAGAAIMGGAGLAVGGGTELANQVQSGEEINATAILNRAVGEGAKSTLFQIPGASLLGLGLGTAGIAAAENVGDNLAKGRMSADALLQAATDGAIEGGTVIAVGGITHAIGRATSSITNAAKKAVPKGEPVKPLPDEALERVAGGAKDLGWKPGTCSPIIKTHRNVRLPILPKGSQFGRNVLNSFAGGKSTPVIYRAGTTLYRIGGRNGSFWSLDPPALTEYQWRVDYAIKQEFCNDASTLYKITIPEGSTLAGLEGTVGPQGLGLYGGAHQVYIDYRSVPSDWIETAAINWK